MPNWKDLGEIPDSEDDDGGFDSQEHESGPAFIDPVAPSNNEKPDIWDFPDSQEDQKLRVPAAMPHENLTSTPARTAVSSLFDSSPLSSPPSDQDLPSVEQLILGKKENKADSRLATANPERVEHAEETATGHVSVSDTPADLPGDDAPLEPRGELPDTTEVQEELETLMDDGLEQEARQVALRYERSLRPRKPIQEHPYMLENAAYSSFLKRHGVKPVRMASHDKSNHSQEKSQDEFQEESQESVLRRPTEDSQTGEPEGLYDDIDATLLPSSPPTQSIRRDETPTTNDQEDPFSETRIASLLDQELPDIDELLTLPPRLVARNVIKRHSSPPSSTSRKRRRQYVIESDPPEAGEDIPTQSRARDSPDPLGDTQNDDTPSKVPGELRLRTVSPEPAHGGVSQIDVPEIYTIEDESEDVVDGGSQDSESENDTVSSESQPESDSELLTVGRRIRGVLPASWLRLDQKSGRDKVRKDFTKRRRERSVEQEQRRGLAQKRQAVPGSTKNHVFSDESDDDVAQHQQISANESFKVQTELVFQPAHDLDKSQQHFSDSETIIEEDIIDPMFSGPSRKRQLKLSESFGEAHKRPKKANSSSRTPSRMALKQRKITNLISSASRSKVSTRPAGSKISKNPRQQGKVSAPGGGGGRKARKHSKRPPRLSILDVIDPGAPQFLRIAARTAKQRRDQGRASLANKNIKLATRQDHLDAMSVVDDWRAGSIKQRPAVSAATKKPGTRHRRARPLSNISSNIKKLNPPSREAPRKLVKQSSLGGTVRYMPSAPDKLRTQVVKGKDDKNERQSNTTVARPAQLEMEETDPTSTTGFHSGKRLLDRLYRQKHQGSSYAGSTISTDGKRKTLSKSTSTASNRGRSTSGIEVTQRKPTKIRHRKNPKPKRLDIDGPEYSHTQDSVPLNRGSGVESHDAQPAGDKLSGLGLYGMRYPLNFDIIPLDPGVYFHNSTLLGSSIIDAILSMSSQNFLAPRPRISFHLGEKVLRWDMWTDQVSSELGIIMDFIGEQMESLLTHVGEGEATTAVAASQFVLDYVKDSTSLSDESQLKVLMARTYECVGSLNDRMDRQLSGINNEQTLGYETIARVYDRLLLFTFTLHHICRGSSLLTSEQFQMEELLRRTAKMQCSLLVKLGHSPLRMVYRSLRDSRSRELGVRNDTPAIHSWVLVMRILEHAQIPRSSFWDVAQTTLSSPQSFTTVNAGELEQIWESMFVLLPLVEFNDMGVVIPGRRYDMAADGWALPQKLLKRVFQLYTQNPRQSPNFNNYCRTLLSRCHHLVQHWGWKRSATMVGVIFDFFGSQNLAHLRNEEVHKSPRFLDELARAPKLDVEPGDKCFHVFLKLIALSIQKLKEIGAVKDIRNLVARTMPNHNRQYLKEQNVHERDLAALRNHHDLLCTLFWVSPLDLRPATALIEGLVNPASSHKEACLINLRAWRQLAQFIVANGETAVSFRPFIRWRDAFFQQMLHQFDSVASDIQQQFLSLPKDVVQSISSDIISAMVSMNKQAVLDVLYLSITSSLDVLKRAPDLESATMALNTLQLQQVFKHFSVAPPEFDWTILRESLAILDLFLSKLNGLQDEESQQSESYISISTQADGAVHTMDRALSQGFFSMARCMLSSRGGLEASTAKAMDKLHCTEKTIKLAAKTCAKLIERGITRLGDFFQSGRYGLFDGALQKLNLNHRRYIVLFVAEVLNLGLDDFSDAGFTLLELWTLSIVKHHESLQYEYQLAEQLRRHQKFVPEAIVGLSVQPDYSGNRDLFEYAIAYMRKSIRDAGPSVKKDLVAEHSKALKLAMEQMKGDLKATSQNAADHHRYVLFVRDIISLIRAHSSDFCTVDDFFYQISKEYSPSAQDPQLQVAGMTAYGLRLGEGDSRAAQQLFFFLFNNSKLSIINDSLGQEARMVRKGMKDQRILGFVLGEMFPAIIGATVVESSAFPLLDIYVEALRRLLSENVIAHELTDEDLPHLLVSLAAITHGLGVMRELSEGHAETLSEIHLHITRQFVAVLNLVCPAIYVLLLSGSSSPAWYQMKQCLNDLDRFAASAKLSLSQLLGRGELDASGYSLIFHGTIESLSHETWSTSRVEGFTDNIINDVRRNWVVSANRITIQTPGKGRGVQSTQSGQGVERPTWEPSCLLKDLHARITIFCQWRQKIRGGNEQPRQRPGMIPVF